MYRAETTEGLKPKASSANYKIVGYKKGANNIMLNETRHKELTKWLEDCYHLIYDCLLLKADSMESEDNKAGRYIKMSRIAGTNGYEVSFHFHFYGFMAPFYPKEDQPLYEQALEVAKQCVWRSNYDNVSEYRRAIEELETIAYARSNDIFSFV